MWDYERYSQLMGIYPLDSAAGTISIDQHKVVDSIDEVFHFGWNHNASDAKRYVQEFACEMGFGNEVSLYEYTEEEMRAWEITFYGALEEPVTVTMGQMIDDGLSMTTDMTLVCQENACNGTMCANVQVTGISVNKAIRKYCNATSEYQMAYSLPAEFYPYTSSISSSDADDDTLIVYEMAGSLLDDAHGWPVMCMTDGVTANMDICQVGGFYLGSDSVDMDTLVAYANGGEWPDVAYEYLSQYNTDTFNEMDHAVDGRGYNEPMIRVLNTVDGEVISPGMHRFEGYAMSFHDNITSFEVSMDSGATWQEYPVGNTDKDYWVYWSFDYNFDDYGMDYAGVLYIRAKTSQGWVSRHEDRVMVNVRTEMVYSDDMAMVEGEDAEAGTASEAAADSQGQEAK